MSLNINHSGDSQDSREYTLSPGQSIDVSQGDSFQIRNPESIANLIPQGKDVLVLTKDGSSYLLKNFLLHDDVQLDLPGGGTITGGSFTSPDDENERDAAPHAIETRIDDIDPAALHAFQSVTILSVISQLSQNTSAFENLPIDPNGEASDELRDRFQSLSLASSSSQTTTEAPHSAAAQTAYQSFDPNPFARNGFEDSAVEEGSESNENDAEDPEERETSPVDTNEGSVDPNAVETTVASTSDDSDEGDNDVTDSDETKDFGDESTEIVNESEDENAQDAGESDGTDDSGDSTVIDRADVNANKPDPFQETNLSLSISSSEVLENQEGVTVGTLDATGVDSEIQGPFTYSIASDPTGLFEIVDDALKLKPGAAIDFETAPADYGIVVRIENARGEQIDKPLTLFPADANDAPELSALSASAAEDGIIAFDQATFEQAFSDIDNDDSLHSVRIDSLPENGELRLGETPLKVGETIAVDRISEVVFAPSENWHGHTEFNWSGFDGEIWSDHPATVSIDIESINDSPVATFSIASQTTNEDAAFSFDLPEGLFSDVDAGDTLSLSADHPGWLSFDPQTGSITGTPSYQNIGDHRITIHATDSSGASTSASFELSVENINDRPTFSQIPDVSISEYDAIDIETASRVSDEDLDFGDQLTYSASLSDGSPLPEWLSIDETTGRITGTPPQGLDTDTEIRITVTDSQDASASSVFNLHVANENDAPVMESEIADQTVDEDQGFHFDISSSFSDSDLGDTLTYTATLPDGTELPAWLQLDPATGVFSGTPENEDVGMLPIIVTASDGSLSARDTFAIMVQNTNDGPVALGIANQKAPEDEPFSLDVSDAFSDVDLGDTLNFSASLTNGSELPDWLEFDETTGIFSGTPENGDVGELSILVVASDGQANASEIFSIEVENTNDGPVASYIPPQSVDEDSAFLFDAADAFEDLDLGDELQYSATLANGDPLPDWITINRFSGELSGTPQNAHVGQLDITVTATDGQESASSSFQLSVQNTNDGPLVSTSIVDQSVAEDSFFEWLASEYFEDVDLGDSLSYQATLSDGSPLPDWMDFDPQTGRLSGTPENSDVASYSIKVVASDGEETAETSFSLEVENVNDSPVVWTEVADASVSEDIPFEIDLSPNFGDVDFSDSLIFSATLENGDPLPDWLSIDPETGRLVGSASNQDIGDLQITVTASDGQSSASDTFTLSVENTNDAPTVVANIVDQSIDEDASFSLETIGTFDDVDADDVLTFSATLENGDPLPEWLSIDPETGTLSGTPENQNVGQIGVKVIATDSDGESASQTFRITIENTNDQPVVTSAIPDATVDEDTAFSLDAGSRFGDHDFFDTLTFSATLDNGDPLPEWLSFDSNTGELSGAPENGDVGEIAITVTATDQSGATAQETFSLTVENTNDGPMVVSEITNQFATEDAEFVLETITNFADPDIGDSLTFSANLADGSPLPDWLSIDPETGTLSGLPQNSDVGQLAVNVTATDSSGSSVSEAFRIEVENTNDGPVATAIIDQTATEDSAFSLDVSGNFSDVDAGDTLTYSATLENGDPLPNWLSIDPTTGQLSGTPENGDVGDIAITVTATDQTGATAQETFGIKVENTNDAPTASLIDTQSVDEDSFFSLDASSYFSDQDLGDTLVFEATLSDGSPLPAWLSFDENTGQLTGTPDNEDVGSIELTISATDGEEIVEQNVTIQVANTNDGPVATAITDQTATEDSAFSLDISGKFSDVDAGDSLTYSATLENGDPLPSWLSIDATTGLLSGTPENADVGEIAVTVTATDAAGATAS
ncbi:putative Ig domain-containing protein, partial [Pelagicoccus sp. SDUM812003]|uniref:putative Ig domain-containing protein n=1 Tax=Pelagicoccus sp. SDUM812003 TaxID=3041267 RepID=UPI00280FE83D